MKFIRSIYSGFKNVLKQPVVIALIALLFLYIVFLLPEFWDFILQGSILIGTKFFMTLAFGLIGVKIVKHAIAFFSKDENKDVAKTNDQLSTAIICLAVYLSVFMLLSAVIIANGG